MKKRRGIIDPHVFINLNKMEKEHKIVLMSHLKEMLIDVKDDRKDIDGLIQDMVIVIKSMQKLKKFYNDETRN